ncbi:uncharacterized protein N7459_009127 [Penicillium hispanicum]|uniref:uncharacterized protein n=1 Tax=Penicillium hispanicum TaxID=1080232 RepID=UPI00254037E6|nr:uncharacterized protein N7459_009127 [Penicillium hispanicum]KAJ5569697.1 hypothetical protein N7459_009127 [Penicillium hispanicum]
MAVPGSVLNRALRSRLARQQLARAGARHFELQGPLNIQRSYSSNVCLNDTLPIDRMSQTSSGPKPAPPQLITTKDTLDPATVRSEKELLFEKENDRLMEMVSTQGVVSESVNREVRKELAWLQDPREMERRVTTLLRKGGCRKVGTLNPQMKKRGGKPNSQTFTILLAGFRDADPNTNVKIVPLADHVYQLITAQNSGVDLDIIHTNAMLTVCQRHNDMKTLWRIAGEMPEEGPLAPDMTTYTIILTGLRFKCRKKLAYLKNTAMIVDQKERTIKEAKRIWADVIYRWKYDKVPLDNQVVLAMALLLQEQATDQSTHDVLALYNQTMGLPILTEKPPDRSREYNIYKEKKKMSYGQMYFPSPDPVPFVGIDDQPIQVGNRETSNPEVKEEEERLKAIFDPVDVEAEGLALLKPDAKDLGVIVECCRDQVQGHAAGVAYWKLLTSETGKYRVQPDGASAVNYLRLLRVSRSSKTSVELIRNQLLPLGETTGIMFHIALSTCRRDIRNKWTMHNAKELMDLMGKVHALPEPRALVGYLNLYQALSDKPEYLLHVPGLGDSDVSEARSLEDLSTRLQARLRLVTIETLRPHVEQLHEAVVKGRPYGNRWADLYKKLEPVSGRHVVKALAWVRLLITETLKPTYRAFVSAEERRVLKSEAEMLKMYSSKEVVRKFETEMVYPSKEQRAKYLELKSRINEPTPSDTTIHPRAEPSSMQAEEPSPTQQEESSSAQQVKSEL